MTYDYRKRQDTGKTHAGYQRGKMNNAEVFDARVERDSPFKINSNKKKKTETIHSSRLSMSFHVARERERRAQVILHAHNSEHTGAGDC